MVINNGKLITKADEVRVNPTSVLFSKIYSKNIGISEYKARCNSICPEIKIKEG